MDLVGIRTFDQMYPKRARNINLICPEDRAHSKMPGTNPIIISLATSPPIVNSPSQHVEGAGKGSGRKSPQTLKVIGDKQSVTDSDNNEMLPEDESNKGEQIQLNSIAP